ncbi:N-acetyltransferase [Oceanospirillum sanctuarii]|uniref:N-acetyltransferase n=1 Tax=Oceanospirillum sanctuarii TaxID=1434821 RepID=UPI000A3B8719|nr:N-acetyltransferase [Oceanospirillum sanctuarii]
MTSIETGKSVRAFQAQDLQAVLDIWLTASIKAHDFIPEAFWQEQLTAMAETYLPAAEVFVYEEEGRVTGFSALYDSTLAALFVHPDYQGKGRGKSLLQHVIAHSEQPLSLSVYKANQPSVDFYRSQGFVIREESVCQHTGEPEYQMDYA